MDSIFEKVKSTVKIADVVERFGIKLDRSGKANCPFHQEKTPSFSVKKSDNIFKCFGCGESGDSIDFVAKIKGVEPLDAAKLLADIYGITDTVYGGSINVGSLTERNKTSRRDGAKRLKASITEYIKACMAEIGSTDYFKNRGLSEQTIQQFCLGFDAKKRCVVVPYSSKLDYYQTRSVDGKEFRKPPTEEAGQEPLWNHKALTSSGAVFIVESPICAMSIMQCGGQALALCGTGGAVKLLNEVKGKKLKCTFILCLDNDEPGRKAQQDLANQLFEINVKFIPFNVAGECKDPNDLLIKDPLKLTKNIAAAINEAKEKFRSEYDSFTAADLMKEKLAPPNWIVKDFLREGVHFLCAAPKIGKSYMAMQLCLAITNGEDFLGYKTVKCDCLYYAIEDGKLRLQERLGKALKGKTAPPGLHLSTKSKKADKGLFEQLESEIEKHPNIKLIIFDTFQRIRGKASKDQNAYAQDYDEVALFMEFVKKHNLAILLIHHLRKMLDESDVFNMISGSMALFGAADTSYILYRRKRSDKDTILTTTGRDVLLDDMTVIRDKETGMWELLGTTDDMDRRRQKEEFESDPAVKVIKALLDLDMHGRWQGSATDFIVASCDVLGHCIGDSPSGLGQKFGKLRPMLYEAGIRYTPPTSHGKKMKHTFQLKSKEVWQTKFYGSGGSGNED